MEIVYASNDGYARHLAVSMYSLFDHNQVVDHIRVFVLSAGISEESKERLKRIAEQFDRELLFLELGDLKERFPYEIDTGGFDISAMGRLFVGTLLPEDVKKVLYLDCDTVVLGSLKKLWAMKLDGCVLGAVMEPTIYPAVKEHLGLGKWDPYFNSGVLLIDLALWRKENVEEQLVRYYEKLGGKTFACDQDTINGALQGKILALPPRYNFFSNYRYFHYSDLIRQMPAYGWVTGKRFSRTKKHPTILHFAGDERPWKAGNLCHYRVAYDQYLLRTDWKDVPKEQGQRLYLFAYHMLDYATYVCPPVRRIISRRFGMKLVENRRKTD